MKPFPLAAIGRKLWQQLDYVVITACLVWSLAVAFTFPEGKNVNRIWSDAEGYYAYLPALFIYHSFEELPIRTPYQFHRVPETNRINLKTTYGVALFEAPFFALAHLVAQNGWFRSNDETGFGKPYSDSLIVCALCYALLTLLLLRKLLKPHFSPPVRALTLATLFWGTSLFYYVIAQPGMSHIYSLFLNTSVLLLSQQYLLRPRMRTFALLGLALGLAVMIRPTNLLMAVFPLFIGLSSRQDLRERWEFFRLHWRQAWVVIPAGLITLLPQFLYWHHISGKWLYYSYGEEGFIYWNQPHFLEVFFGVVDGLFVYTPLLLLGFVGIEINALKNRLHARLSVLVLLIASYLIASWWAYWFGGSFGHRAFIDYYALLGLGMATVLQQLLTQPRWVRVATLVVLGVGIFFTVEMGYAYRPHWSELSWSWDQYLTIVRKIFS